MAQNTYGATVYLIGVLKGNDKQRRGCWIKCNPVRAWERGERDLPWDDATGRFERKYVYDNLCRLIAHDGCRETKGRAYDVRRLGDVWLVG